MKPVFARFVAMMTNNQQLLAQQQQQLMALRQWTLDSLNKDKEG